MSAPTKLICAECGNEFVTVRADIARFCTKKCQQNNFHRLAREKNQQRKCAWCHRRLSEDMFFPAKRDRSSVRSTRVCKDCMPFEREWDLDKVKERLPECGKIVAVLDPEFPDEPYDTFEPTCPLFDNCRERLHLGFDPPCWVPDRFTLLHFLWLSPKKKFYVRKLFSVRFDAYGNVVKDDIDNYLSYYAEV